MKPPFKKECKHAQRIRKQKWTYSPEEIKDGCWVCKKELVLCKKLFVTEVPRELQHLCNNKDDEQRILDRLNEPEWWCPECTHKRREEGCTTAKSVEDIIDSMDEDMAREIKEVSECGPDCPLYPVLLDNWLKDYDEDGRPRDGKTAKELFNEMRKSSGEMV